MRIDTIEFRTVRLPLVSPFRTSFLTEYHREALLVRVRTTDGAEGWGECVAMAEPRFSSEYLGGALDVLQRFLLPLLRELPDVTAAAANTAFRVVKGHAMAKAALETAILDAELRIAGSPLAAFLGATETTVPAGVSVGIMDSPGELLDAVAAYREAGYQRIKLKIQPGWDETPVRAVRDRFGDVPLQVDANCAYTPADMAVLLRLNAYDLLMIEQPFPADDLWSHVVLSRRLAGRTPVCLDESISSPAEARTALRTGAAGIINIKPGRVGGYLTAKKIHDICTTSNARAWVGGMLETGIGRAANLALAALPGLMVGDLSTSDRFFRHDITPPFTMAGGRIAVPTGPGTGVSPDPESLDAATVTPPVLHRWR